MLSFCLPVQVRRLVAVFFVFTCCLLQASKVIAQKTWSGAAGASWNVAGNWTPAGIPAAGDAVIINGGATPVVTANAQCLSIQINNLSTNGSTSLTINAGQTLTVGTGTGSVTIGNGGTGMANNASSTNNILVNGNLVCGTINQLPSVRNGGAGGAASNNLSISATGIVTVTGNVTGTTVTDTKGPIATAAVIFTGSGTLNVTGAFTTSVFTPLTGIVNYNGSAPQTVNSAYTTFGTLKCNNPAGLSLTGMVAVTNLSVGDIVSGSILNDNGFQITGAAGGLLNLYAGTINLGTAGAATSFPVNFTNVNSTLASGTTVNYQSGLSQTIAAVNYGNLTNTGNGARVLAGAGSVGIKNSFVPGTGAYTITGSTITFNGTGAQTIPAFNYNHLTVTNAAANISLASSSTIGIAGLFTPGSSSFGNIAGSTISFNGIAGAQTIPAFTFNNLNINNASGISSIGGNISVNANLALTSGILSTGVNTITVENGGFSSRTNGWVNGNLQQYIGTLSPEPFPIGDASNYRPLLIDFAAITTPGFLTAAVTSSNGLHPQIASSGLSSSLTVVRYWNLTTATLAGTYDASFGFIAADVPVLANTSNFVVRNYTGVQWLATTTGSASSTSTSATGLTGFGSFSVGETTGTPLVSTQPSNTAVCEGGSTSLTTTSVSVPTPMVQWQRSIDGTNWDDIDGSTDAAIYTNYTSTTLGISGASISINGYLYRALFTNINGTVTSDAKMLTVTQPPTASINYPTSPFGSTVNIAQAVDLTGTNAYTGGTFSSTAGLSINGTTGEIMPNTSTPGTYIVTYTLAPAGGCAAVTTTTSVTVTLAPTAEIQYAQDSFCISAGVQTVVLTGTGNYTGGSFTSTAGLVIDGVTGAITPNASTLGTYVVTYNIPASAPYPASTTTTTVTISPIPTATISYAGGPFCTSDQTAQPVTLTGTGAYTNGTYSSSPAGLVLDAVTGAFTPFGSTGDTYTITYTIPAAGGCAAVPVTTTITIVNSAIVTSLQYNGGNPVCMAFTAVMPVVTGTGGGTFSYTAITGNNLSINTSTGEINPGASDPGDYEVIYTIPPSGPCGQVQATALVSIVISPVADIVYNGQPYCVAGAPKTVTLTGTGAYTGGSFAATPAGLNIDANTGTIVPASSTVNLYTVTYTTANCPVYANTTVQISAASTATIDYTGKPFCQSDGAIKPVSINGDMSGTFSAPAGLSINTSNGDITPSTSLAGTYLVSYTIHASGTCSDVVVTTTVTITALPTASISYSAAAFCQTLSTAQPVTLTGSNAYTGGVFSAPAGLSINTSTGAILPSASTAGTYLVTYLTAAGGGCLPVAATTSVTITALPTAAINYSNAAYCISDAAVYPVTLTGTAAYTGGTFNASPAGLSIDASGTINPASSLAGMYTVTYTVPASGGCAAVPAATTVTINEDGVIALASAVGTDAQTKCLGTGITSIVYQLSAGASGAIVSGLPTGITGSYNGTSKQFTLAGTASVSGIFNYTVTTTGTCIQASAVGTITINAVTVGGALSPTLTAVCSGGSTGNITLSGHTGSVVRWEQSINAGSSWTTIAHTATTYNTTVTQATLFRVIVQNGIGVCAEAISGAAQVVIDAPFTPVITASVNPACLGTPVVLTASGYTSSGLVVSGGDFASANPPGWNGASANNNSANPNSGWGEANGPKVWNGVTYNASGKFMIINGTGTPGNLDLTTPVFSLVGLSAAYLSFNQAYNLAAGAQAQIQISIDGGSTYSNLQTYTGAGAAPGLTYGPTNGLHATDNINLSAYLGLTNLKIRFLYTGVAGSNWALDNIVITNSPSNPSGTGVYNPVSYSWSPGTNLSASTGQSVTFTPVAAGSFTYNVTTTTSAGCTGAAAGTITVVINEPVAITTQPAAATFCVGDNTALSVVATGTLPVYQWQVSTTGSAGPWTNLTNTAPYSGVTAATLNFTNPSTTLSSNYYRVVITGTAPCGVVNSNAVQLQFGNVWMGTVSSDWNNAANWSAGVLPSVSCATVYIPNRTNQPLLSTAPAATINNLVIEAGATLTITNTSATKMRIAGTITNSGNWDVRNGSLELNGSTAQSITGGLFVSNIVKDFTIANPAGVSLTGSVPFNIAGELLFGNVNNSVLNTGNNLVLLSTDTSTARVADITNNGVNSGNAFSGSVTYQRYYPAWRSWRLVTAPLSGAGSVFNTWQNGGVYTAGRGTYVTGPGANPATNGLDVSPLNNTSLRVGSLLSPVTNTLTTTLSSNTGNADNKGFFLFVRGDRVNTNFYLPNATNTTLVSTGTLQTGVQNFPVSAVAMEFSLVGNPYASPVDLNKITRTNLAKRFVTWDPKINEVGGYITLEDMDENNTYSITPASVGGQDNHIQSGQAFFVQTENNGVAEVQFNENDKTAANNLGLFRPLAPTNKSIRVSLYKFRPDGSRFLADGLYAEFDSTYNMAVDIEDAFKFTNINETFGLYRNNKMLAVERRPLPGMYDTLYLKLNRTSRRSYQFEIAALHLEQDNLAGYVQDKYLNEYTPISMNGTSLFEFYINEDAASADPMRFNLVFKPLIQYSSVNAEVINKDVAVSWTVLNEQGIALYEVERSLDGSHFEKQGSVAANYQLGGHYHWLDAAPVTGSYYYRIRCISNKNVSAYSSIVKVKLNKGTPAMYVLPNPVSGNMIQLQMNGLAGGIYKARLLNNVGQLIQENLVVHTTGTAVQTIPVARPLPAGSYQLQVTAPGKKITTMPVIIQ